MRLVHLQQLPHRGSSRQFVGADHGGIGLSAFFYRGQPGRTVSPHWHPYVEVHVVQSGRGRWQVGGEVLEAGAGDVLVIEPGEVHGLTVLGDEVLQLLGLHLSPSFVQTEAAPDAAEQPG